jgi:Ser/Thr protein kinase RdoA (MazF antagonist)
MSSTQELTRALLKAYDLQASEFELIYDGINKIIKFRANNKNLTLKLFNQNNRTHYQISYERKIVHHIIDNKIACIVPIDTITNQSEQIYRYEGQHYYGIVTIEDTGCTFTPTENLESQISIFGESLYKLHTCKLPNLPSPHPYFTDENRLISRLRKDIDTPYSKEIKALIITLFKHIHTLPSTLSNKRSICHGDAWPGNALYHKNSCVLLDFEHTSISTPAFDISTFIWWATGQQNNTEAINAWSYFKQGYGETLENLFNEDLPRLIKLNELRSLVFIANYIVINEELLGHLKTRTQWFIDAFPSDLKNFTVLNRPRAYNGGI